MVDASIYEGVNLGMVQLSVIILCSTKTKKKHFSKQNEQVENSQMLFLLCCCYLNCLNHHASVYALPTCVVAILPPFNHQQLPQASFPPNKLPMVVISPQAPIQS